MSDQPTDPHGEPAAPDAKAIPMVRVPLTLGSTGRTIALIVPPDFSLVEAADMCAWVLSGGLNEQLTPVRPPTGQLLVAKRMPDQW